MPIVISIAGSMTRNDNNMKIITRDKFEMMCQVVENIIDGNNLQWHNIILQSGGGGFIDHIAVVLGLKYKCKVRLFLAAKLKSRAYEDTNNKSWAGNPGRIANYYHLKFSEIMGYNTMYQIEQLRKQGATLDCTNTKLRHRSYQLAKCDMIIVFSQSITRSPKSDRSAYHIWSLCTGIKIHVSIPKLN